jgi:hypothetical protein
MPPEADGIREADRRQQLSSYLSVICLQTQILQRRVARMDRLEPHDRERLDVGLAAIFTSATALGTTLAHLPPSTTAA